MVRAQNHKLLSDSDLVRNDTCKTRNRDLV